MEASGSQLCYRIAFASLRGMNHALASEILGRVGSEQVFFDSTERQLSALMGFCNRLFDAAYRSGLLEKARKEVDFVLMNGIKAVYFTDDAYPVRLREAADAPLLVYMLGQTDLNRGRFLSIVGTRHATPYGIDFVNRLVEELSERMAEPLTVVSGLASGIDAAAHKASLRRGVPTVGVLAHGLNMIYPAAHRSLAADMVHSGGALLTEYMSSDAINKGNFPARNRIVAAMSDAVVVAESAVKGGALITARLASGYDRDVFALPGRTSDRYSAGCNRLIFSNVAALAENADDVLRLMGWPAKSQEAVQKTLFVELSDGERAVMDYLAEHGEAQVNLLSVAVNIGIGRLMSTLVDLEFKGLVVPYPGGKYRPA